MSGRERHRNKIGRAKGLKIQRRQRDKERDTEIDRERVIGRWTEKERRIVTKKESERNSDIEKQRKIEREREKND
jgi:hypothetical protein